MQAAADRFVVRRTIITYETGSPYPRLTLRVPSAAAIDGSKGERVGWEQRAGELYRLKVLTGLRRSAGTIQTEFVALPHTILGERVRLIVPASVPFVVLATNVSQPQILALFRQVGTDISHGTLAHWLMHDQDVFHAEQDAIVAAGLRSSPWQQLDDTPTRVNGQNQVCQVLGNPLSTAYRTTPSKARLAVLDTLRNGRPRRFRLTDDALAHLDALRLAQTTHTQLVAALPWDQELDEPTLLAHLQTHLPRLSGQARQWVLDALALAADHAQLKFPVVRLLVCDDAPQFHMLLDDLALCWVHKGRHYKKLSPWVPAH